MLKLPNSIEPAVMAENIVYLRDAEASLDGRVSDLEVTAPKDYSTTETATGQKWIDGKDIYCRVLSGNLEEISVTSNVVIGTLENINFLYSVSNLTNTAGNKVNSPFIILYNTANSNIAIVNVTTSYSRCAYIVVIYYTKPDPTPGRAPEDEPEEVKEPEEKKITKKKTTK